MGYFDRADGLAGPAGWRDQAHWCSQRWEALTYWERRWLMELIREAAPDITPYDLIRLYYLAADLAWQEAFRAAEVFVTARTETPQPAHPDWKPGFTTDTAAKLLAWRG